MIGAMRRSEGGVPGVESGSISVIDPAGRLG